MKKIPPHPPPPRPARFRIYCLLNNHSVMNCKCIEEIEARVVKEFKFKDKHKITKCDIQSAIIFGDSGLYTLTCSEMELTVEGMKRSQKQNLMHSYCPFCGIKIEKK